MYEFCIFIFIVIRPLCYGMIRERDFFNRYERECDIIAKSSSKKVTKMIYLMEDFEYPYNSDFIILIKKQ